MTTIVEFEQVSKQFDQQTVLDELSLKINKGEIFGILGPNGAGKSTLVNIITGLLPADGGRLTLFEKYSPGDQYAQANIGLASQSLALYEELTAAENLLFFGTMQGLAGKQLKTAAQLAIQSVDLEDRANQRVKHFSGGMKRRLNLAIAGIHKPSLLICDEPTVGVDPQSRNAIMDGISKLRDQGHSIIYTSHYMEEVEKLCDRVAIIDHGTLIALDTVPALIEAHGSNYQITYRHNRKLELLDSSNPLESIRELINRNPQGDIDLLAINSPTLEQVFMNLTGRELRD